MKNRLNLNFLLDSQEERVQFLSEYFNSHDFTLNESELETCADYLLWGKNTKGENSAADHSIELTSKYTPVSREESLDALLEQPTFSENMIRPLTSPPTKIKREVFSRESALKEAPAYLRPIFEDLFHQIDRIDLEINFYEIAHGKRTNPPRDSLLQLPIDEQLELEAHANTLTQFQYLKLRRRLIELRREQYTFRDSYTTLVSRTTPVYHTSIDTNAGLDSDIPIYPLGVFGKEHIHSLLFKEQIYPEQYSAADLEIVSRAYWEFQNKRPRFYIDFCNPNHVHELFDIFFEIQAAAEDQSIEQNLDDLLRTLEYYCRHASLTDIQHEILELKIQKCHNQDIAAHINTKYQKTYSANYISTIFCQKIIPAINAAAAFHAKLISNIFFPENFKQCITCGEHLLIDEENFIHKTRSKDGYANRCKRCDKLERNRKKNYVSKFN